ncbi:MAG: hypothetical protein QF815_01135 [Candidatus Peribacteraceae bacterium]|nr:hypothetical protein [Candidatus Peribacteraceae bacterium]
MKIILKYGVFPCIYPLDPYPMPIMPRGKRTVFTVLCSKSGNRVGTIRLHKQDKQGKGWKEHVADMKKYCSVCKSRQPVKVKEERHSK